MNGALLAVGAAPAASGFKLPEGFTVPDNTKPGETFQALVTLKLGDDGQVTPEAVDGIPLAGGDDQDAGEENDQDGGDAAAGTDGKGNFMSKLQGLAKPMGPDDEQ